MAAIKILPEADLEPNQALRITIDDKAIALVKDSAGVCHAIGDTCTHGDISLSEGFVEDDTLECWAHGSKFDLKSGKPLTLPAYVPVEAFPVVVEDGVAKVDVE